MQKETNYASIWSFISMVLVAIVTVGLFAGWYAPETPTADDVAASVLAGVTIPTAEEIAAEINLPEAEDTIYSVYNDKRALAIELAEEEMDDRDFKEDLARTINDDTDAEDIERQDIKSIEVRDIDTDDDIWSVFGDEADVDFVVKVTFDDFGDDEWVKLHVYCDIEDLNWNDNYEDAEVDNCHIGNVISDSY